MSFPECAVAGMPAALIAAQKPPPEPGTLRAEVLLSSFPPLAQVTKAPGTPGELSLVVCLQIQREFAERSWEVNLLSSMLGSTDWHELPLASATAENTPMSLQVNDPGLSHIYFTGSLSLEVATSFTFRFRDSAALPWRLARDDLLIDDGIVLTEASLGRPDNVRRDILQGLDPGVTIRSVMSQAPGTSLWALEAPISGPRIGRGDQSVFSDVTLGLPWGGTILRWFALVRIWTPWLAPRHGKSRLELQEDAIVCALLDGHGRHLVLLPISGVGHVTAALRSGEGGRVLLRARSDSLAADGTATVLAAVGEDFERTLAACMYHARDIMRTRTTEQNQSLSNGTPRPLEAIRPEWMEDWYDGLGFCTWNALGQNLTAKAILQALDTLAENEINISTLIIDDGWQDVEPSKDGQFQSGLNRFEAAAAKVPGGLKALVSSIRARHPQIQHVVVWHALLGYWGGISPNGELARLYKTVEVEREKGERRKLPLGGKMTVVAKEDVERFYHDFYLFLASCGVDGVKTDAQFILDTWTSSEARRGLTDEYLDAWTTSSLRHFSNRAISCMSQTPHIIYHSQMPRNRPAITVRQSDDFFPQIPESHPWHVWTNAHNGLFTQYLNIVPDWDMFQTSHDYSGYHAAARAISGGPIYITDEPGKHDRGLISQMTGVTPRGKTVVFRPSVVGRSIDAYVGYTDDSLLKIGSFHGGAKTGTPMLGVFNVASRSIADLIPLDRFRGVSAQSDYVVRAHSTGRVTAPMLAGLPRSMINVSLRERGYEILTAFAISGFESPGGIRVLVANLGLLGRMAGPAALVSSEFIHENGRVLLETSVKALGVIGVYISELPQMDIGKDFIAMMQGAVIPQEAVTVCEQDRRVLAIDVEKAWIEMGLDSGWSNEVRLRLYLSIGHLDSGAAK